MVLWSMTAHLRIRFIFICFLAVGLVIVYRLFSLQIREHNYFIAKVKSQSEETAIVYAERGEIFMRDKTGALVPLAQNKEWPFIFVVPKEIAEPKRVSGLLAPIIGMSEDSLLVKLGKQDDPYEIIKKFLTSGEVEKIRALKEKGIYVDKEFGRLYPNKTLAAHLVGFLSFKNKELAGQYGLEEHYHDRLQGDMGEEIVSKDVFGTWVSIIEKTIRRKHKDGEDIVLTIDPNIQARAEEELKGLIASKSATGGTVIIMDPKNGAIRAMASYPTFDPNAYANTKDISVFMNPATQIPYEPGSTFKPITFSVGLETGAITPETTYTDKGEIKVDDRVIKNFEKRVYGLQTMTNVLEFSINTGAVFVEQRIDKKVFSDYLEKFGLGKKTGIDTREVQGTIANLKTMRDINYATASFGQGITMTPISLINAISALANNGVKTTPYLVEKFVQKDGTSTPSAPLPTEQVISQNTAKTITKMMVSVVEQGSGKRAKVPGYSIAGKTGTAQIPDLAKGGYTDDVIHNFVGFAPASDPKFSILIKIDRPRGKDSSSGTVANSFYNLAQFLFQYYEIPPDEIAASD